MSVILSKVLSSGSLEYLSVICKETKQLTSTELALGFGDGARGDESFYNIFLLILDRILGDETTACSHQSKTWKKGEKGGWLRVFSGLTRYNGVPVNAGGVSRAAIMNTEIISLCKIFSVSIHAAELIDLLSPHNELFSFICRMRREYEIRIDLLPRKMQMRLLRNTEYDYLRWTLYDGYDSLFRLQDSGSISSPSKPSPSIPTSAKVEAVVYFFLCLLRYPCVNALDVFPRRSNIYQDLHTSGSYGATASPKLDAIDLYFEHGFLHWLQGNPYLVILELYFSRLFLWQRLTPTLSSHNGSSAPISPSSSKNVLETISDAVTGSTHSPSIFSSSASHSAPASLTMTTNDHIRTHLSRWFDATSLGRDPNRSKCPPPLTQLADLFLRVALQRWADGSHVVKHGHAKLLGTNTKPSNSAFIDSGSGSYTPSYGSRQGNLIGYSSARGPFPSTTVLLLLPVSTGSTPLPPSQEELQCLFLLVSFLQADPALPNGPYIDTCPWPPAIMTCQQPVFDLLRVVFAKPDSMPLSNFALATQIWLLWLQPWNGGVGLDGDLRNGTYFNWKSGRRGSDDRLHRMGPRQEAYIANNLHFYSTLLVMFVNALVKLKITPYSSAKDRLLYIHIIDQTLQVFDKTLVASVDHLVALAQAKFQQPKSSTDGESESSNLFSGSKSSRLQSPDEEISTLLDSIKVQHRNLFPDPFINTCWAGIGFRDELLYAGTTLRRNLSAFLGKQKSSLTSSAFGAVNPRETFSAGTSGYFSKLRDLIGGKAFSDHALHVHVDRLINQLESLLDLPYDSSIRAALETPVSSATTTDGGLLSDQQNIGPERCLDTGKLTQKGEEQIYRGIRQCERSHVGWLYRRGQGWSTDCLIRPLASTEWEYLAITLINISMKLNEHFGLPRNPETTKMSWFQIRHMKGKEYFVTLRNMISAFRFNFRFLANLRAYLIVVLVIAYFFSRLEVIGIYSLVLSQILTIVPIYLGSYPRFYPNGRGILLIVFIVQLLLG